MAGPVAAILGARDAVRGAGAGPWVDEAGDLEPTPAETCAPGEPGRSGRSRRRHPRRASRRHRPHLRGLPLPRRASGARRPPGQAIPVLLRSDLPGARRRAGLAPPPGSTR